MLHVQTDGPDVRVMLDPSQITVPGPICGFAFSVRKAGSTMLNGMLRQLAANADVPYVSVPQLLRSDPTITAHTDITVDGTVYELKDALLGGYRLMPAISHPVLKDARKVLLLRDPLDIVVSNYFSAAYSHRDSLNDVAAAENLSDLQHLARTSTIDAFVRRDIATVEAAFRGYAQGLPPNNLRVYWYEEVVARKYEWVSDLCDFFHLAVRPAVVRRIADRFDVWPTQEDPTSHIRSVTPGDHLNKLSTDTVTYLRDRSTGWSDPFPNERWSAPAEQRSDARLEVDD